MACVWTCVVLLLATPGIVVVFASQAFIVDTPNGTVHVDPSGLSVSTADNPTGEYPCLWYGVTTNFLSKFVWRSPAVTGSD